MRCPGLTDLPPPPPGKTGWPWTEESQSLPDTQPEGGDWPRISIVTPSYNQGKYIEEAIRSILLQGYPNLEYVIIDGASSDGAVDTIRKYDGFITTWVSEPDEGQYQAINKGIARCTGDIFNWINSDDMLCPEALGNVARAWVDAPGTVIAGSVVDFSENGTERVAVPKALSSRNLVRFFDREETGLCWAQPGIFPSLAAVRRAGGLREDLRYVSDRLLIINVLKQGSIRYIPNRLVRFRLHDDSKTVAEGHAKFKLELVGAMRDMPELRVHVSRRELRRLHCGAFLMCANVETKKKHLRSATRYFGGALGVSIPWTLVILSTKPLRMLRNHARGFCYSIGTRGWRGTWRFAWLRFWKWRMERSRT